MIKAITTGIMISKLFVAYNDDMGGDRIKQPGGIRITYTYSESDEDYEAAAETSQDLDERQQIHKKGKRASTVSSRKRKTERRKAAKLRRKQRKAEERPGLVI